MNTELSLSTLKLGLPALTSALGEMFAEAASICLEEQNHESICSLLVQQDDLNLIFQLQRLDVSNLMRRAYRDSLEATEFGACAIALLVVREITGDTVIERSVKGTGFDYWLGAVLSSENDEEPFERKARLEISGIRHGTKEMILSRLEAKLRQTQRSSGLYPSMRLW